jgi:hypothetical protein
VSPPGGPKPARIAPFFVRGSRRRGEPCLGSLGRRVFYIHIYIEKIYKVLCIKPPYFMSVCLFVYGTSFLDGNKTHVAEVDWGEGINGKKSKVSMQPP